MSYGFKIIVEGDYALFTRPEMKEIVEACKCIYAASAEEVAGLGLPLLSFFSEFTLGGATYKVAEKVFV